MSQNVSVSKTKRLMESAIMVSIATVLSLIRLLDLPYGGSVTIGCMLPVMIIAYRHGFRWGLVTGFVFGLLQQLLGLKTLSYVTTWQSIIAVILLDYLIAFMMTGFAGLFQRVRSQPVALTIGAVVACILRFICHVISGATVWAGLSIPSNAALIYSVGYNATYMIPETVVTAILAYYVGSVLDFGSNNIAHLSKNRKAKVPVLKWIGGLILTGALLFDVRMIFMNVQNAETGDFDVTGYARVNWMLLLAVTAVCAVVSGILIYRSKSTDGSGD